MITLHFWKVRRDIQYIDTFCTKLMSGFTPTAVFCKCYFLATVRAIEVAVAAWQEHSRVMLVGDCLKSMHMHLYRYQISPPPGDVLLGNPVLAANVVKATLLTGSVPHDVLLRYHRSLIGLHEYARPRPPRHDKCDCCRGGGGGAFRRE